MAKPESHEQLFDIMYTCRAMRRFKPDPVPEATLLQLVDARAAGTERQQRAELDLHHRPRPRPEGTDPGDLEAHLEFLPGDLRQGAGAAG
jgi:hypothetical protein